MVAGIIETRGDVNAAIGEEVAGAVGKAVEAAVGDLNPRSQRALRKRHAGHLLCALLTAAVEALTPLAEADKTIAEAFVGATLPHRLGLAGKVAARLLKGIVARLVDAAGETALAKIKAVVKLMRVCAVVLCPDHGERHEEVGKHCVAPLAGEQVRVLVRSEVFRMEVPAASDRVP